MDPTTPGGPVLSASALETLGSCPLRYFFRYALGLKPPDEVELDPTRWLDPMQFGNLAHEVFYTFGAELIKERRKPLYERDLPKLLKVVDVCIKRHQFLVPAPNDSAVRRQILELESAAKVFLVEEEIISHKWRPTMLEASIGLAANPEATVTLPDPMSLRLSDGSTVRTRGKIDRVDKYDSETESIFRIVDYKLGSSYKYEQGRNFSRGSIVQHILYSQLAENLLRHSNIHTPIIHDFVYFFPGIKTRGLRIHRSPKNETEFDVIGNLCKIISNAAFIATNDSKDCKYCDYLIICDDPKTQTEFSFAKLKNSRNKLLDPVRELRGI
jgi:ATP-dependent helicase/nuclease subunit B